jgi:hypothetical protein
MKKITFESVLSVRKNTADSISTIIIMLSISIVVITFRYVELFHFNRLKIK